MSERTRADLQYRQRLPLDIKVAMTRSRIREWIGYYGEDGVYVSFSGGKDSTVLLDIVRRDYPNVPAVFVDIPTQYPELKRFVMTFDNVVILRPEMNFFQVCEKYGFPIFGKEIAQMIYDARRYLTKVEAKRNAATDRQTDRQLKMCLCVGGFVRNRTSVEGSSKAEKLSTSESGDYP